MKALIQGSLLFAMAAPAAASFNQTPTGWWLQENVSLAQIAQADQQGWRPTSIDNVANGNAAPRYNVTYVKNSGSHYKKWILAELKTPDQLNGPAYAGYRMIDVFLRYDGPVPKYTALFIQNTGADQREWYWRRVQPFNTIISEARTKGFKPVSFDMKLIGGAKYTAIFVKNKGMSDETTWWAYGSPQTGTFVADQTKKLNAIPAVVDDGLVLEARKAGDRVGSFVKAPLSWIDRESKRLGLRASSIDAQAGGVYNGVFVTNINADTAKVVDDMAGKTDGLTGVYLRRIGTSSPSLYHQQGTRFYPSSTMKIFLAFHGIGQWLNYATGSIAVWPNSIADNHQGETPTMTLFSTVVSLTLRNSNNQMANAIIDAWTRANINNNLKAQGLNNTAVVNKLGTGPYGNDSKSYTTLNDLGLIYQRIHENAVFDAARRNFLYNNMISDRNSGSFNTIVNTEAASLGLTLAQRNSFYAGFDWCAKAGSNGKPGAVPAFNSYQSIAGYAKLPYKNGTSKSFVFGMFTVDANLKNTVNVWTTGTELLRKEIRAALQSWK